MRSPKLSVTVMAMLLASLADAGWNGYTETRDLELSADGIRLLEIDASAGEIIVTGVENADVIRVKAVIHVDDDDDGAQKFIAKRLVLKLESKRDVATLDSYFDDQLWRNGDGVIDLEVLLPHGLSLFIDDGSGAMRIAGIVGDVEVDDGSGSITIAGVTGNVTVDDGSGDIHIRDIGGTVKIDDGSGSIDVRNVEHDLEIDGSGSGAIRIADVRGAVYQDD